MWDPRAVIVLVLAIAVSSAHVMAVTIAAIQGKSVGEAGGDVLVAILGAIVAIIAGYVGRRDERPEPPPPEDEPPGDTTRKPPPRHTGTSDAPGSPPG